MDLLAGDSAGSDALNPHRLLLASAGTGKTFQLANHFAGLLVCGVEPDRILATTFTRKAAGEILDRVLGRVREAAREDPKGEEARGHLVKSIRRFRPDIAAAGLSAEHCESVLAALVRRIDRFQIRTLDAFFIRLARLFAMELAIAPEWRITDVVEERAIVSEAVARVLDGLEFDERLELLRGMTRGSERLGAEQALVETVTKAEDIAKDAMEGAWRQISELEGPTDRDLAEAIETCRRAQPPLTKAKKPNSRWDKNLASVRGAIPDGPDELISTALLKLTLVQRALTDEPFAQHEIPSDLKDALVTLARQVVCQRVKDLIARNHASESFMDLFMGTDRVLRAELGAYRFQDFPRALLKGPARQSPETWTMDLGYRLDARLDHLLLDEFQDTAPSQWQLLLPLVEEVLSDGSGERSFFCVGDVKQSIYGWRGGEPRLLQRMAQRHPVLNPESLTESYRSSSVVLDTVNRVFEGIEHGGLFADPDRRAALNATQSWSADYAEHTTAKPELLGEARLWQARPARKGSDGGPALEKPLDPSVMLAVERVVQLRGAHPLASIAILVRARAQIARIRYLLAQEGIEASDEGGNPLTDAIGVTWILALMHLGDHPTDGVAALQVARSPFAQRYGIRPDEIGTETGAEAAIHASQGIRESLLRQGYGAFADEHSRLLAETASAWDARRLEQLVELALAHDERPGLRPVDFVDTIRETRVPDPTASTVKVMTIHASKGLEFDIVVLPELGKPIRLTPGSFMGGRRSEVEAPSVATATPNKETAKHHEQLGALYRTEQERSMVDALSGLYVAMTRAVHCVEMIVPAPSRRGEVPPLQHASLVAEPLMKLTQGARDGDPDGFSEEERATLLWEHPDSSGHWSRGQEAEGEALFVPEAPLDLGAGASAPALPTLPVQRRGGLFQDGARSTFPNPFEPQPDDARRLGVLVHALFEDFFWKEDEPRSEEELIRICQRLLPGDDDTMAAALAVYRGALESPVLDPLFREPSTEYRLATERTFDVEITDLDVDPLRWRGTIDRLLLGIADGVVVTAKIVDFKTESTGDAPSVLARHSAQLEDYRRAISTLFELDPHDIECLIVWLPGPGQEQLLPVPSG